MQSELFMFDKGYLYFFFKFDFQLSFKIYFIYVEILMYYLVRYCCVRINFQFFIIFNFNLYKIIKYFEV